MPFYLRKSVSLGPIRFNLSKSGIGTSLGVKGFRLGSGPRGNYVHMGRHGLYFRKSLGSSPRTKQKTSKQVVVKSAQSGNNDNMLDIESFSVDKMIDSSSSDLLEELNQAQKRVRIFPVGRFIGIIVFLVILIASWPGWLKLIYTFFLAMGLAVFYYSDIMRKSVVIIFNMEEPAASLYGRVHDSFDELLHCEGIWHIEAESRVHDNKYLGGASGKIRRKRINLFVRDIPIIKTNIDVPQIPVGKQILAFLPERLLVFEGKKIGAVAYDDLVFEVSSQRFVERGKIPRDTQIVGQTWKYVNKDGGPDRRFKNNPQYPIVLYEYIHFSSSTGLNEEISISKPGFGQPFEDAVINLSEYLLKAN